MKYQYRVALINQGNQQTLTIPQELMLSSPEVIICQDGKKLIIEPYPPKTLLETFATLDDLDEDFPDIDEKVLPLDDINF